TTSGTIAIGTSSLGLSVNYTKAENGVVLQATGGLTSASSNAFNVQAGAATQFQLTANTITPTAGVADQLTLTALDSNNNVATSYTGSHTSPSAARAWRRAVRTPPSRTARR